MKAYNNAEGNYKVTQQGTAALDMSSESAVDGAKTKRANVGAGLKRHTDRMRNDPEYRQMMIQKYKSNRPNAISIDMMDRESGELINTFPKIMDGAAWIRENTDYSKADYATINKICKGYGKTAYGFKWRYTRDR